MSTRSPTITPDDAGRYAYGDPFEPGPDHLRLRAMAADDGRELARRLGDDLVGRSLGYEEKASAIARLRLERLSAERAIRVAEAKAAVAAAAEQRELAVLRFEEAVAAANAAGIDHPTVPSLAGRVAGRLGLDVAGVLGAAVLVGEAASRLTDSAPLIVGPAVVTGAVLAAWLASALPDLATPLRQQQVGSALKAMQNAFVTERDANACLDAVLARADALARGEAYLADELIVVHHEAATLALAPGALADGAKLVTGVAEVELPAWVSRPE
jgi:hypothetical protein